MEATDYDGAWKEILEALLRPFLEFCFPQVAMVIAAHLAAQNTAGDMSQRQVFKWNVIRRLYHSGFDRQAVLDLFRLLDWLLVLPKELEVAFRARLLDYEEETRMPHITSIERLSREEGQQEGWRKGRHEGWQEGRQEGWREGRQEDILEALAARFGEVPSDLRQQIKAIADEDRLKRLHRQAVIQPALASFLAHCQDDLA